MWSCCWLGGGVAACKGQRVLHLAPLEHFRDWPVTKYSGSYGQHKKIVTDHFAKKGRLILKKVMYDNAHEAYRLERGDRR